MTEEGSFHNYKKLLLVDDYNQPSFPVSFLPASCLIKEY
jgi:hypothetical protein